MFRTRVCCLLLSLCCVMALAGPAAAAETDSDQRYCFSPEDFSGDPALRGICITQLPDSGTGTLLLDHRVLAAGDILTAEQVARMTFSPVRTEEDTAAQVGYLPIFEDHVAASAAMTIGIRGKVDQPPVAENSAMETYKNLPNTDKLKASDPEGQMLTFTVVRQPRRGTVTIGEDGSFTYTPKKNKVGVDSFVYTATDPAGKVSREATVTVTILKPTEAAQYTDTLGRDCRFAAEWMKHSGIFVGETLGENSCFSPDKPVTRGEFVTMLVQALEIPVEPELSCADFGKDAPDWLQPYVAAALRAGMTAGLEDRESFGADSPILAAEAEAMVRIALDRETEETFASSEEQMLTRGQAAQILYRAAKLAAQAGETEIA